MLHNVARSSVCLTVAVIFAPLRWWGFKTSPPKNEEITLKFANSSGAYFFPRRTGPGYYDFCSRFFAPFAGVPEDPVCGSAHAVMAPYWAKELKKRSLAAWQCSGRGGEVRVDAGSGDDSVRLSGAARVVMEGILSV